jgi:hypothetical protein
MCRVIHLILALAFAARVFAADPATQSTQSTSRPWPRRYTVEGLVEDANQRRAAHAMVYICDAATGMPYSSVTDHPFSDPQVSGDPPLFTHMLTGGDGRFHLRGIFPGTYRVIAQSWEGLTDENQLGKDLKSDVTTIHGIVENVHVPPPQGKQYLTIKPIGSATLRVSFARNDTFIAVSTAPPQGDVILGPLGWRGEFLKHMVAFHYMRGKTATIHGLPEGKLYLRGFYNDRHLAVGEAEVTAKAGETIDATLKLTSQENFPREMPPRVKALADAMAKDRAPVTAAVEKVAPNFEKLFEERRFEDWPMEASFTLGGETFTLMDLLAVQAYRQNSAEAKRRKATTQPPATSRSSN